MAEKLLITQALDERDLLAKRIKKIIDTTTFVAAVREKDKKIDGVDVETVEKEAISNWNSVMDLIDRYDRISRAIIQSNATLTIKFSDGTEMTKAEAIARKNLYKEGTSLSNYLINKVSRQLTNAIITHDRLDQQYTATRNDSMKSLLQAEKSKELNEEQIKAVDLMVAPYEAKMVDPIKVSEVLPVYREKIDTFLSEVDTLIKVSNATSYIEF